MVAEPSVEGELSPTGTNRTYNKTVHERVQGQFREVSQELAQEVAKMGQDNQGALQGPQRSDPSHWREGQDSSA